MSWVTWPTWPPCPYMVKTLKKSSSPEPIDRWPWNFVCSIVYASTTKIVQTITQGWPWQFYAKVKFGDIGFCMGKIENYLFFFGNCCSLRSQSCLKHSPQWVNEVEWVSKVKVILWPWSKVTQISKLNVWLLARILRWAIQGPLALLFSGCGRCVCHLSCSEEWNRLSSCNTASFKKHFCEIYIFEIEISAWRGHHSKIISIFSSGGELL